MKRKKGTKKRGAINKRSKNKRSKNKRSKNKRSKKRTLKKRNIKKHIIKKSTCKVGGSSRIDSINEEAKNILDDLKRNTEIKNEHEYLNYIYDECWKKIEEKYKYKGENNRDDEKYTTGVTLHKDYRNQEYIIYLKDMISKNPYSYGGEDIVNAERIKIYPSELDLIWPDDYKKYFPSYEEFIKEKTTHTPEPYEYFEVDQGENKIPSGYLEISPEKEEE